VASIAVLLRVLQHGKLIYLSWGRRPLFKTSSWGVMTWACLPFSSFDKDNLIPVSCIIFRRPMGGGKSPRGQYNNYRQDDPPPKKEEDDDNWDLPEEDVLNF